MNIPALFSATLVLVMVAAPASATLIYESNAQGRLLAIDNLLVNGVYYRITFPWFPPPFFPVAVPGVGENYTAPIGDGSEEAIKAAMSALADALSKGGGPWVKGDWCNGENEHNCYVPFVDSILTTSYQGLPQSRLACDQHVDPLPGDSGPGRWGFCDIRTVPNTVPVFNEVPAVWSIVPEPSTISLMSIGLFGLWSRKRGLGINGTENARKPIPGFKIS